MRHFLFAALVAFSGCQYFKHVPLVTQLPAGRTLRLSHTKVCTGDKEPIDALLAPQAAARWSVLDEKGTEIKTGVMRSNLALDVSTLPVGTYRVVVVLDADDVHLASEAAFGVFHCVYM